VARSHEHYWRPALESMPPRNVIVQPRNCGTGNGLLLGVLHILERDPLARVVVLPADHHVCDQKSLSSSVRAAAALLNDGCNDLLLIDIAPDDADPDLGYIIPGAEVAQGISRVAQFVEKPSVAFARHLIARGAVWNSLILAAHGTTVVARIRERYPQIVEGMTAAITRDVNGGKVARAVNDFYEDLPTVDFSRAVAQGGESTLRVFTAPACGWSDLGTPRRVWNVLQRLLRTQRTPTRASTRRKPALVNLAAPVSEAAYRKQCKDARFRSSTSMKAEAM
jgi:mannose-1-phosphate guanylyltransferase